MKQYYWMFVGVALTACATQEDDVLNTYESESKATIKNNHPMQDELGVSTTWSTAGSVHMDSEFFEDLGTNGRQCGHCHKVAEGWTVSAAGVRNVFDRTCGLDPIFRTNDGTTNPNADVSTLAARREAYSMLLSRGTIRVGIGIPAGAEFELADVDDPYGFASAAELSLFRRPLPSANLTMIPVVMWDGRVAGASVHDALTAQSNGATQGHAAAPDPISQELREEIVGFESGLFNAQLVSKDAGRLDSEGARGGAEALASQTFVAARFDLYDAWEHSTNAARRAVFRGQELFNNKKRSNGGGACRFCHSTANVGTNKNGTFFTVGIADGSRRAPDQPLYTLHNLTTGEDLTTTDPGRALITGKWSDVGKFKVPSLRALGARAPYFHNGSADTLLDVVHHYEDALGFPFTASEEADLVAFLSAL